jgi:hypothetical protein
MPIPDGKLHEMEVYSVCSELSQAYVYRIGVDGTYLPMSLTHSIRDVQDGVTRAVYKAVRKVRLTPAHQWKEETAYSYSLPWAKEWSTKVFVSAPQSFLDSGG